MPEMRWCIDPSQDTRPYPSMTLLFSKLDLHVPLGQCRYGNTPEDSCIIADIRIFITTARRERAAAAAAAITECSYIAVSASAPPILDGEYKDGGIGPDEAYCENFQQGKAGEGTMGPSSPYNPGIIPPSCKGIGKNRPAPADSVLYNGRRHGRRRRCCWWCRRRRRLDRSETYWVFNPRRLPDPRSLVCFCTSMESSPPCGGSCCRPSLVVLWINNSEDVKGLNMPPIGLVDSYCHVS